MVSRVEQNSISIHFLNILAMLIKIIYDDGNEGDGTGNDNKLASLKATPVPNQLTGVKCRATSVTKKVCFGNDEEDSN